MQQVVWCKAVVVAVITRSPTLPAQQCMPLYPEHHTQSSTPSASTRASRPFRCCGSVCSSLAPTTHSCPVAAHSMAATTVSPICAGCSRIPILITASTHLLCTRTPLPQSGDVGRLIRWLGEVLVHEGWCTALSLLSFAIGAAGLGWQRVEREQSRE